MAKPTVAWDGTQWIYITEAVQPGRSAFELAQLAGYTGTLAQWLASLQGPAGPVGPSGGNGPSGAIGPVGPGLPAGGEEGWALAKASNSNYDFKWVPMDGSTGDPIYPDGVITGGVKTSFTDPSKGWVYNVHTFSTPGTVSMTATTGVAGRALIVGGGGAGGNGNSFRGGGGGGGGAVFEGPYVALTGATTVTVGAGGSGASGGNSVLGLYIANGGGRGGNAQAAGTNGGCGGGAGMDSTPGSATFGSTDGGATTDSALFVGENGFVGTGRGGFGGGARVTTAFTGTSVLYSERGDQSPGGSPGVGYPASTPGSGGPGGGTSSTPGGPGANGLVVFRYRIA